MTEAEAKEQLETIANALGLVVDVRYASDMTRCSYIKLLNKVSGKCASWIRDDNSHAAVFGMKYVNDLPAYQSAINDYYTKKRSRLTLTDNELKPMVAEINSDVYARALAYIIVGNFTLKVSNTRKVKIPSSSSVEELLLKLSINGTIRNTTLCFCDKICLWT